MKEMIIFLHNARNSVQGLLESIYLRKDLYTPVYIKTIQSVQDTFNTRLCLMNLTQTESILCTIIAVAAPPPLQIAAQPYSPGFN
jgi:hypothetical protein